MANLYLKPNFLLQLPLFSFVGGNKRKEHSSYEWSNGQYQIVIHNSDFGIPTSLDQDVFTCLLYLLYKSRKEQRVKFVLPDIADLLKVGKRGGPIAKIKKSLLRLSTTKYIFINCFPEKSGSIETNLIDIEVIGKGRNMYFLASLPDLIQSQIYNKKYQVIDFDLYLLCPRGLPRRMYELLEKYKNQVGHRLEIGEEKLSLWLNVQGKYFSYRKRTILSTTQKLQDIGYLESCNLEANKFLLRYKQPSQPSQENQPIEITSENQSSSEVEYLISILRRQTKSLCKTVTEYYIKLGYDFVYWSILYANKYAKNSYTSYLQKTLKKEWALDWAEEEKIKEEQKRKNEEEEIQKQAEKEQKQQNQQTIKKQKPRLIAKIEALSNDRKIELWKQADSNVPDNTNRRENVVKTVYLELLWQCINQSNGSSFSRAILSDLSLAMRLQKPE